MCLEIIDLEKLRHELPSAWRTKLPCFSSFPGPVLFIRGHFRGARIIYVEHERNQTMREIQKCRKGGFCEFFTDLIKLSDMPNALLAFKTNP